MDEEKEPHFVLGKSRFNAMDYPGAINSFEESLEANPHSAQAHYQLAMLYENQESDPAAAIYHYQQYLKYDPQAGNAEIIERHITNCKRQLVTDVNSLPSTPAAQQQLEKTVEDNHRLQTQLAQWQAAYFALKTNPPAAQNNSTMQNNFAGQPQTSVSPDDVTSATTAIPARTVVATQKPAPTPQRIALARTHKVIAGETLASIARKHGVSLQALEEANPKVNPKKLKAGQMLNLPSL